MNTGGPDKVQGDYGHYDIPEKQVKTTPMQRVEETTQKVAGELLHVDNPAELNSPTGLSNRVTSRGISSEEGMRLSNAFGRTVSDSTEDAPLPITNRFFAHVFGDASIKNSDLEGSTIADNKTRLQTFFKTHKPLMPSLEPAYRSADKILESLQLISLTNAEELPAQMATKVAALKEGESLLLEGGWKGSGTAPGHACLYEFKKKAGDLYDITIYNTGSGAEHHAEMTVLKDGMQKTLVCPFIEFRDVSKEMLCFADKNTDEKLLRNIPEESFFKYLIGMKSEAPKSNPAETLYKAFAYTEANKVTQENLDSFITLQRSGTCSFRCILALLKKKLPPETYKIVKLDLKLTVLTQFYEQEFESTTSPVDLTQKQLFMGASNKLIRSLSKLVEQKLITPTQKKQLLAKIYSMQDVVTNLPVKEIEIHPVSIEIIERGEGLSLSVPITHVPKEEKNIINSVELPTLELPSALELKDFLPKAIESIMKSPRDQQALHVAALVNQFPLDKSYFAKIPGADLPEVMTSLRFLSYLYTENPPRAICPSHQNTVWTLLAVSSAVAFRIDPELAKEGLSYAGLENVHPLTPCFSQEVQVKREQLLAYFKEQCKEGTSQQGLFNFTDLKEFDAKDPLNSPNYGPTIRTLHRIAESDEASKEVLKQVSEERKIGELSLKDIKNLSDDAMQKAALLMIPKEVFSSPKTKYIEELQSVAFAAFAYGEGCQQAGYICNISMPCYTTNTMLSCSTINRNRPSIPYQWVAGSQEDKLVLALGHLKGKGKLETPHSENAEMLMENNKLVIDVLAPTLQCQKVIYDNQNAMHSLLNPLAQELFFCSLFAAKTLDGPMPIQRALQSENFKEQISTFIKDGLDYFQNKSPDGKVNIAGCLFFAELIRRLELVAPDSSLNLEPLLEGKINTWLSSKELKGEEREQLHLHRLLAYSCHKNQNTQVLKEIMTSWLFLCHHPFKNPDSWTIFHQKEDCDRFIHSLTLGSQLKTVSGAALDLMLNASISLLLEKDIPITNWDSSEFPIYSGLDSDGKVWKINTLNGDITCDSKSVKLGTPEYLPTNTEPYKELFGEEAFSCIQMDLAIEFKDSQGHQFRTWWIQGQVDECPIQMKIEGEWFEYVPVDEASKLYKDKIPNILLADCHVFTDGTKVLFVNKNNKEVSFQFLAAEGLVDRKKQQIAGMDQVVVPALELFEEKKWHLYETRKDGTISAHLSRFTSLQTEEELQFTQEIKGGPFKWSGNTAFELIAPDATPLGPCSTFLFLQDPKTGNKKVLVPLKPIAKESLYSPTGNLDLRDTYRTDEYSKAKGEYKASQTKVHSYLEYDIKDQDPSALNLEGTLYLSYIYLAQKKPQEALALLQELPKEVTITPIREQVLEWITHLPMTSASSSSSSVAVALRASLILIRDHEKKAPGTALPEEMAKTARTLVYSYKNRINHVEGGLALSKEELQELGSALDIDMATPISIEASAINEGKEINTAATGRAYLSTVVHPELLEVVDLSRGHEFESRSSLLYNNLSSAPSDKERVRIVMDPQHLFYQKSYSLKEYTIYTVAAHWEELSPLFPGVKLPFAERGKIEGSYNRELTPPFDEASIEKIKAHFSEKNLLRTSFPISTIQALNTTVPKVTMQSLLNRVQAISSVEALPSTEKCTQMAKQHLDTINRSPLQFTAFIDKNFTIAQKSRKEVSLNFSGPNTKEKAALQESLLLGQEANKQEIAFSSKNSLSLESIKKELRAKVSALEGTITKQKESLHKLVNKPPEDLEKAELREQLLRGGYTKKVEIEEVITAFLDGSKESYLRLNPHLTPSEIEHLDQELMKFLINSNEAAQGTRALTKSSIDQVGKELSGKMEYAETDRLFLVFEHRADMRIREKQVKLIRKMLETTDKGVYKDSVSQLMMGGGKTSVLASILLQMAAKPGRIAFFVPPANQFSTLATDLAQRQKKNFTCNLISMNYKRSDFDENRLTWMQQQFIQAKEKQEVILATPETLQALPLELESLLSIPITDRTPGEIAKIGLLTFLVSEMSGSGDILIDEIDLILSAKNETIFTKGSKKSIKMEEIDLVKEVLSLHLDPDTMNIQGNEQGSYGKERYKKEILPQIAERFFIKHPELAEYRSYILGATLEKPEISALKEIQIEALKNIFLYLPSSLDKSAAQKYDRSPLGSEEAVIPYESRGNPTTREFGTPIESALYHFQTVLSQGVSENQLQLYAKRMIENASQTVRCKDVSFLETPEALAFKQITGCDLTVFSSNPSPNTIKEIVKYINESTSRKLELEKNTIYHVVGSFPGYFESDAQRLCAQFSTVRGFSGTPWNHAGYPEKLRSNLHLDLETEGRIIDVCLQKETANSVRTVSEVTIANILQSISPEATGLIDSAGLLKKLDTETAARQIFTYHKNNEKIQTVLFFNKEGVLCGLKKHKSGEPELVRIGSTQKTELQKHGILPDSTFVYYDECHTEATDIAQVGSAKNAILIDHKTTLRTALQGILRLRDFFNEQSVEYVIADNEKHHFLESFLEKNQESKITVSRVIEKGIENQAKLIVQEKAKAYKQKIDNIFKEELFPLGLEAQSLEAYQTYFFTISDQSYPHNLVEYKEAQIKKFKLVVTDITLQERVTAKLNTLIEKIQEDGCADIEMETEGRQVEVQLEKEKEITKQQETTVELEYQQELEGHQERSWGSKPFIERKWLGIHRLFEDSGFASTDHAYICKVSDAMNRIDYYKPYSYQKLFKDDIFLSNNFAMTRAGTMLGKKGGEFEHYSPASIFDKAQKVANQILIRKVNGSLQAVMLSSKDAVYFKAELEKEGSPTDTWLLLPDGTSYTANTKPPEELKGKVDRLLWQVNFFNGNVSYLLKHKELTQEMMQDNTALRQRFLALKVEQDSVQKALFYSSPLLSRLKN